MTPLEELIAAAFGSFKEPGGILQGAIDHHRRMGESVVRIATGGEMPHMGLFAESVEFYQLCRLLVGRHLDGKSWTEALARTREGALKSLMSPELGGDAWSRAYLESCRSAASRFLRQTEYLAWREPHV